MRRTTMTLGTFDGVHRGHQRILRSLRQAARQSALESLVVTFPISPRFILRGGTPPQLLTEVEERQALLRQLRIDRVQVLPFTHRLSRVPAEEFFHRYLVQGFRAAHVVVGYNFAFGQARRGNVSLLRRLGRAAQVRITQVAPVRFERRSVSSQRIRELIHQGAVEQAAARLGYPYSLAGVVVRGSGRGKRLGCPTANLQVPPHKILPLGVFGVRVYPEHRGAPRLRLSLRQGGSDGNGAWEGVCNVGYRPTFGPSGPVGVEVHLLGWEGSLLGRRLRVMFLFRIRAERCFAGATALERQLRDDVTVCARRIPGVTARLYKRQTI